jgi:hypothetical protein
LQPECQLADDLHIVGFPPVLAAAGVAQQLLDGNCDGAFGGEQDQRFRIVARVVLSREQKKERTIMRRASLTGVKSEKSIRNKVETVLENYLDEYGEHEVLENIQRALGEKVFL